MPIPPCPRCGAALHGAVRFCTSCGSPLGTPMSEASSLRDRAAVEPQLLHCPACEASNAASREHCGRCGADLVTGIVPALEDDVDEHVLSPSTPPAERESAGLLIIVTVLAVLAVLGVVATILSARGFGLFAGPPEPTAPPTPSPVEIVAIDVSSQWEADAAGRSHAPENLLDGDDGTAWVVGAPGDGTGEWVELRFAAPVSVTRVVLWNGYQDPGRFREFGRVRRVRMLLDEQALTADILDLEGAQAVDLPGAVVSDNLRIEILQTRPGTQQAHAALSGIEVIAATDG